MPSLEIILASWNGANVHTTAEENTTLKQVVRAVVARGVAGPGIAAPLLDIPYVQEIDTE